jgi:hypothetical protein
MAVQDDVRRLSQMDSIYLGQSFPNIAGGDITSWHKGRLQQANDGSWVFRAFSSEGTIIGFQLGSVTGGWQSVEAPSSGVTVTIFIKAAAILPNGQQLVVGVIYLQQQLPQEMTN